MRRLDFNSQSLISFRSVVLFAFVWLTGCATPTKPPDGPTEIQKSIDASVQRVGALQRGTDYVDNKPAPASLSGSQISATYIGEAAVLLPKLAAARGLKFSVTGPQPHLPLMIYVNEHDTDFKAALSRIAKQFGGRANLVLTDSSIEIRYRNNASNVSHDPAVMQGASPNGPTK